MTQNLPAQQKANSIRQMLSQPSVKKQLALAIPKHMSVDRLLRVAVTSIRTNPRLLDCDPQSLLACVMGCAQLGLEPEPFLGQAYLVPYWNSKKNSYEAQLIPGYRGYIALARRSGEVQSVSAHVVHEHDEFQMEYGLNEMIRHVPAKNGERGEPKGAYCVFRYKDGSYSFDHMDLDEIEKVRNRSKAKDSGPWKTDWEAMARKTVIRRHIKLVPLSVEMAMAAAAEDRALMAESQLPLFTEEDSGAIDATLPQPQGTVEEFEKFVESKGLGSKRKPRLDKFLEATAQAQNISHEQLQQAASLQFDEFWKAFEKWERTERDKEKKASGNGDKPSTVECPAYDGRETSIAYCNTKCEGRDDCPAWEEADHAQ